MKVANYNFKHICKRKSTLRATKHAIAVPCAVLSKHFMYVDLASVGSVIEGGKVYLRDQ